MKKPVWLSVLAILTVCLLAAHRVARFNQGRESGLVMDKKPVAFIHVNVVLMDAERVLTEQTVIVKDGRIAEIGPASRIKVPANALRVDSKGKYLLPGLVDMHVHLQDDGEDDNRALFRLFLANGVTTILNLYGTSHHLELREKIKRGEMLGPALYTSGPFVSNAPVSTPTAEEVERAVVEQKRAGYDFIKIHGDFSREAYRKLFEVARREGIRVIGHAPRNLGVEVMLEERQHVVAHAEEYLYTYFYFGSNHDKSVEQADRETKRRYLAKKADLIPAIAQATARAGVWVIPNLTAYKGIGLQAKDIIPVLARPEVKYVPAVIARDWQPERNTYVRRFGGKAESAWLFEQNYGLLEKLVKGLRDAGVKMLAGTDTPIPSIVPGFSLNDELADLVAAGLTPYEALRTATINAAEFLGTLDQSGTVAVGKRADIILLEGDPLKDVRNTTRRAGVMVGGRWLSETEIRRMLSNLTAR